LLVIDETVTVQTATQTSPLGFPWHQCTLDVNFAGVNPSTSQGHISVVCNAFILRLVVVEVSQKSSHFSKGREWRSDECWWGLSQTFDFGWRHSYGPNWLLMHISPHHSQWGEERLPSRYFTSPKSVKCQSFQAPKHGLPQSEFGQFTSLGRPILITDMI